MRHLGFIAFIAVFLNACASFAEFADNHIVSPYKTAPYRGVIPLRQHDAEGGHAFVRRLSGLSEATREAMILREIRRGNIPEFLRELQPVTLTSNVRGQLVQGTIWVTPDYLAVGDDDDFVRVPLTPIAAQRVADHFGFVLPTRKVVDEIYRQAKVILMPSPLKAGPEMGSIAYYLRHNDMIEQQRGGASPGKLTAGHKKDVVLSNILDRRTRRVAIYGWHRRVGSPIQPLSIAHHDLYADYSHGIRLVANTMLVNGRERPVVEVMQDPAYASLLSDEGIINKVRIATNER